MSVLLVDENIRLKKFPGKGGWTFAEINNVVPEKNNPFGWVKVKGRIDSYSLVGYKLMPMGNGKLFFPVKAAIRKSIGKHSGDFVHLKLYRDESPTEIPPEILECFKLENSKTFENFNQFTDGEKKAYLDWIYSAKREDTKVQRIAKMMDRVSKKIKYYDHD